MLKVAAVLVPVVVAGLFAISADAYRDLPQIVTNASVPAGQLGFALLLGALAFAGGGGGEPCAEQLDPRQAVRHG